MLGSARMVPSPKIRELLDAAYSDFHTSYYRGKDPISLVHEFSDNRDREVVAFLAACLSYGNVTTILASVRNVLGVIGREPYQKMLEGRFSGKFNGFRHRFTTGDDIEILCAWLSEALRKEKTLEDFFLQGRKGTEPMKELLSDFVVRLTELPLPTSLQKKAKNRERNLKYLISDPERGSACKRLNMFLRWMVRPPDGIDLGLWSRLSSKQLMLPIDTHLLQTLQNLRWTRSKQATWKVVEAATMRLRLYEPNDPIRYDFALCHLSMTGKTIRAYAKVE